MPRSAERSGRDDGRGTRDRRAREDRLEAETDDRLLPLGTAKKKAYLDRPNGSRPTPRSLSEKAAVYINTDSNGRGFLGMGGSHTLEKFINEVGKDIPDPQTKMSRLGAGACERHRQRLGRRPQGSDGTRAICGSTRSARARTTRLFYSISGSLRWTSALAARTAADHIIRFTIRSTFSRGSSIPGFAYGVALAKVCGHAMLRLANADTLPFEFTNFADTVGAICQRGHAAGRFDA